MLIDQRVQHLLLQTHLLNLVRRERLAVHLLVVLFGVVESAIELAGRDRLPVHTGRVCTPIDSATVASTASAPVDENEEDEDRNNGDQNPFEVLKAIAHQLEHRDEPLF